MRCLPALLPLIALLAATGCAPQAPPLLGTLEWDRIGVAAEASEPITAIAVNEGDTVAAGQLLLELDGSRAQAQLEQAEAERQRAQALLDERLHGARAENVATLRAEWRRADAQRANERRERDRAAEMRGRGLIAQAELDRREASFRSARAEVDAVTARLAELTNGTRPEQVEQAQAALAFAEARVKELSLARERLRVHAPADGRVDALPFKRGDQPPRGATVVSLLTGDRPYARVYVPAPRRAAIQPGAEFTIHVQGAAAPFHAALARIRSEPAFTPYYALSGDDASQLVYRAELVLDGTDETRKLPAGLTLTAEPRDHGR
ncbi:HlyD family secretion protein [Tahibacter amnicola]|uniref:Biotin/lipoyl-binding protein n=1 Tax=Tahibacter amnicola TaxID=2976241 RepID=A0ABY6BDL3_9GAMM|nr:biotin/lipoyl-binding protein [Tahibacter amnicola]UXI67839.1 biotin/lipoyl-binding protein [Tahibacter amnicola]